MRSPAIPSIDQLLVLLAVAEVGSFSAAAKRLGRATSAISYAIDTLEAQLGLSLFDRGTTTNTFNPTRYSGFNRGVAYCVRDAELVRSAADVACRKAARLR